MSSKTQILDEDDKKLIARHLAETAPNFSCPVCSQRQFMVADDCTTPVISSLSGGIRMGGKSYPMVMLICNNCFHVVHFMAVPLGLMNALDKDEHNDEK